MSEGFGGGRGFGARPAVVVVDLVNGFTDPASPLGADLDEVVESTRTLLDARARGGRAGAVHHRRLRRGERARRGGVPAQGPGAGGAAAGSRWIEVDARLGRRDDEPVLPKAFASAFFGTPLASMLAGHDTLVVCGATTSGCVRATVVDALQHGLAPIVPRECVGDRWHAAHEANLFDIEAKYGDVVSLSEAVGAMHEAGQRAAENA